jgi:hypothetical protein
MGVRGTFGVMLTRIADYDWHKLTRLSLLVLYCVDVFYIRNTRTCARARARVRAGVRRGGECFIARTTARRGAHDTVRPKATAEMYKFLAHFSLTCVDGNALVRNVSWVSSPGRRRGMESTKAA